MMYTGSEITKRQLLPLHFVLIYSDSIILVAHLVLDNIQTQIFPP